MLFPYVVPFLGDLPGGLLLPLLSDLVEFLLLVFSEQRTNLLQAVVTNFLELVEFVGARNGIIVAKCS